MIGGLPLTEFWSGCVAICTGSSAKFKRAIRPVTNNYLPLRSRMRCKVAGMASFRTDSVTLSYSDVEAAKRWWVNAFDCKQVKVPPEWDNPLPSDVALRQIRGKGLRRNL